MNSLEPIFTKLLNLLGFSVAIFIIAIVVLFLIYLVSRTITAGVVSVLRRYQKLDECEQKKEGEVS